MKTLETSFGTIKVDDDTYDLVAGKNIRQSGTYPVIPLHHLAFHGQWELGLVIDHIDGDPLNCQRSNLRLATMAQNMYNKGKVHKGNPTSRFKGVCFLPKENKWRMRVGLGGAMADALFDTEGEAAIAADMCALYYYKEFARLNFPNIPYQQKDIEVMAFRCLPKKKKSTYMGVSMSNGKWIVKKFNLEKNIFDSEEEAAEAIDLFKMKHGGFKCRLNFPEKYNEYLKILNMDKQLIRTTGRNIAIQGSNGTTFPSIKHFAVEMNIPLQKAYSFFRGQVPCVIDGVTYATKILIDAEVESRYNTDSCSELPPKG